MYVLKEKIYSQCKLKNFDGIIFSPRMISTLIEIIAENYNTENIINYEEIWNNVLENENIASYKESENLYEEEINEQFHDFTKPMISSELLEILKNIRIKCLESFTVNSNIREIIPEIYDEYVLKLQVFIDCKEEIIIKTNDELAIKHNKKIIEHITDKINKEIDELDSINDLSNISSSISKQFKYYKQNIKGNNNINDLSNYIKKLKISLNNKIISIATKECDEENAKRKLDNFISEKDVKESEKLSLEDNLKQTEDKLNKKQSELKDLKEELNIVIDENKIFEENINKKQMIRDKLDENIEQKNRIIYKLADEIALLTKKK